MLDPLRYEFVRTGWGTMHSIEYLEQDIQKGEFILASMEAELPMENYLILGYKGPFPQSVSENQYYDWNTLVLNTLPICFPKNDHFTRRFIELSMLSEKPATSLFQRQRTIKEALRDQIFFLKSVCLLTLRRMHASAGKQTEAPATACDVEGTERKILRETGSQDEGEKPTKEDVLIAARRELLQEIYETYTKSPTAHLIYHREEIGTDFTSRLHAAQWLNGQGLINAKFGAAGDFSAQLTLKGKEFIDSDGFGHGNSNRSSKNCPTKKSIRDIIIKIFPLDSELNAFLLDHFHAVYQKISTGMDRVAKMNILIESVPLSDIWMRLQKEYFDEYEKHKHLLVFESNEHGQ